MSWPAPVERLASVLARLPGVGRRSASRMALALARNRGQLLGDLQAVLRETEQTVLTCTQCGGLTLREANPCALCTDPRRDDHQLCVVEDAADIETMESSGGYRGRYWALGGRLAPVHGEGPASFRLDALQAAARSRGVTENILALNFDVESDATAAFLQEALAGLPVRVTRLARGIPAGSGLAYADSQTLASALQGRQPL